ncbi:MAG: class I SAM-dependent methyltransferase [Kiritimatiellae bacterium]|nr:class I SAM-dependent methyltransferase [Kiritimatiellia bacterium]
MDPTGQLFERQKIHSAEAFRRRLEDGSVEIWFDHENAGYWGGFEVVMRDLRLLFVRLARRRILTIGDGKGGKEAAFFKALGHEAIASDFCIEVLREAARRGIIDDFAEENAEKLIFPDDAFDLTFCKESLHHMQRPYLAIYEMIRVCCETAIIIEPWYRHPSCQQVSTGMCLRRCFRRIIKGRDGGRLAPHPLPPPRYEESGNYVFKVNPYELTQCARAMGLPAVAIGYAHSAAGADLGRIRGPELDRFKAEKEREMAERDRIFGRGARPLLVFFFFKRPVAPEWREGLDAAGFTLVDLTLDRGAAHVGQCDNSGL